jgi:hypothetical protein
MNAHDGARQCIIFCASDKDEEVHSAQLEFYQNNTNKHGVICGHMAVVSWLQVMLSFLEVCCGSVRQHALSSLNLLLPSCERNRAALTAIPGFADMLLSLVFGIDSPEGLSRHYVVRMTSLPSIVTWYTPLVCYMWPSLLPSVMVSSVMFILQTVETFLAPSHKHPHACA